MEILLIALLAFLLGTAIGAGVVLGTAKAKIEIYYKRWQDANDLVRELEAAQVNPPKAKQIRTPERDLLARIPVTHVTDAERKAIRKMATWDRRDLEVQRAKLGQPPADDLSGMASWDVAYVLQARIKHAAKRQDGH